MEMQKETKDCLQENDSLVAFLKERKLHNGKNIFSRRIVGNMQ